MRKSRVNPGFLTPEEATRERERTDHFVRSITGKKQKRLDVVKTRHLKEEFSQPPTRWVSETENFRFEFNEKDRLISLAEKKFQPDPPSKLTFSISESKEIINLLLKAKALIETNGSSQIGETKSFAVDHDYSQKVFLLYEKKPKCSFKLAINETELDFVVAKLAKTRSLL